MDTKPTDLFEKYKDIVVQAFGNVLSNENELSRDDPLFMHKKVIDDLGADSLDAVEIIMYIEDDIANEIPDDEAEMVDTVLDLILLAMKHDGVPQHEIDFVRQIHPLPGTPVAVRRSLKDKRDPSKTNWSKADAKTDKDIARDVASDPDAAPLLEDGESLGTVVTPRRMSRETMDQIIDEATHAALTVLQSSGVFVNSMQRDALNDSLTAIVQGDNDTRSED